MASDNDIDLDTHAKTYNRVLGLLKYGAAACFVIAGIVVWLISGK